MPVCPDGMSDIVCICDHQQQQNIYQPQHIIPKMQYTDVTTTLQNIFLLKHYIWNTKHPQDKTHKRNNYTEEYPLIET